MEQARSLRHAPRRYNAARPVRFSGFKLGASLVMALSSTASIWACSGVGPRGKPVVFGDQTNIIIWDQAHHTEHFIRNANFRSGADDFGFIAPTPGKPQLNEASNQAFYTLASLAPSRQFFGRGGGFGGASASKSSEVRVIQEADVAGFHATTLWSTNAHAINDWMNEHGYVSTPEVEKWAERYTARRWFLTAFKVIDKTKLAASTGTVRMTFKAKRPFNPFYVPASNIQVDRKGTLRVYFVSEGDYDANIGNTGTWQIPSWTAPIPETTSELLAKQVELPSNAIPPNAEVETFVDNDFPRPAADDIYFSRKRRMAMSRDLSPLQLRSFALPPTLASLGLVAVARRRRYLV